MKQVTKTTAKKKTTKLQQKKRITTTQKLAFIFVVAALGAYLISKSFASDLFSPNQLALMQDDTTKPYVVERVKTTTGDKIVATSQPFSLMATTQGAVYCDGGDGEMRKVTIDRKSMRQITDAASGEITTTKAVEASTIASDGTGETTMVYNGKNVAGVTVKSAANGQRYKRKIQGIKNKCLTEGKKVSIDKLPDFTLPPAPGVKTSRSIIDVLGLNSVAHAAVSSVPDITAEKVQYDSIRNARYSNAPRMQAYYRMTCLDKVAQNWSRWMAATRTFSHNPKWIKHIEDNCNVAGKWSSLGENVGYGPTSSSIFTAYMNSAGHKANILSPKFTRVGVGAWWDTPRLYTTHNFMRVGNE